MTWIVRTLMDNPGEWDAARDEVRRVRGDRPPTGEDLSKLVRVHGVVQGTRIRAGRRVFYSPYVTHRLAEIWPEPERFMPERRDPAYRKHGPHEFLPFGGGPHRCVGSTLAVSELTVLLTRLLTRVTFQLGPSGPVEATKGVPIRPNGGLAGRVTRHTVSIP